MPYVEETCVAGKTVEICKYHSARFGKKGTPKEKRGKPTSEAQKKCVQRRAEKNLRRLMNNNFVDGDWLVRMDFHKNRDISSEDMQKLMNKFTQKFRYELRKRKMEFKYIYVKEVGPRGGRHVHMVMNESDIGILRKCWPHGGIDVKPLWSDGQYSKIAQYFIKYAARTETTEGKLIGKRWYASRNLVRPNVDVKVVSANTFRKKPKQVKGYILDPDSVESGISELTGFEFYSYTLIKAPPKGDEWNK